ncbi:MAG: hypothetical protein IJ039_03435 [Clostridia bacterium]|nr:hypothetical protein [Clostridia bacterium]
MLSKIRFLNANTLKIIAAVTMLIDHMGMILFPHIMLFRIIGRLSFPIFAFMISEGARYTKNKLKYILTVGILGVICQIPMMLLFKDFHWNILITFTLSLGLIYLLDWFKKSFFDKDCKVIIKIASFVLFVGATLSLYYFAGFIHFHYSYGFYGCMVALFASAPSLNRTNAPEALKKFDNIPVRLLCMSIPLLIYSYIAASYQFACLLSLVIILLYSGKKGKLNLKYFFYIFYPAHLVVLYGIGFIISLAH